MPEDKKVYQKIWLSPAMWETWQRMQKLTEILPNDWSWRNLRNIINKVILNYRPNIYNKYQWVLWLNEKYYINLLYKKIPGNLYIYFALKEVEYNSTLSVWAAYDVFLPKVNTVWKWGWKNKTKNKTLQCRDKYTSSQLIKVNIKSEKASQ